MSLTAIEYDRFTKVETWAECNRPGVGAAMIQDGMTKLDAAFCARICASCAVKKTCFDVVRPRESYFSGMCAGVAWNDGKPMLGVPVNDLTDAELDALADGLYATLADEVD